MSYDDNGGWELGPVGKILVFIVVLGMIACAVWGFFSYRAEISSFVEGLFARPEPPPVSHLPEPTTPAVSTPVPPGVTPAEPGEGLPAFTVGIDAFASYYNAILIEQLELDTKYGFDLQLITFCSLIDDPDTEEEEPDNCFSEDVRTEMMVGGQMDAMCTTLDKEVIAPESGKITSLVDETDGADKVVVNPNLITTINDLKGKDISYMVGSVGEFFLYYLLNLVQIPVEEVILHPSEDVIAATELYLYGRVTAVSGWEPDVDAAVDAGGNILIDSGRMRAVIDVIITSHQMINEEPELTQAFHNAWFEALKYQFENPSQAEQLIIDFGENDWSYVYSEGELVLQLETIAQASLGPNQIAMTDFVNNGENSQLAGRLREAKEVWQWAGKVIPEVSVEEMVHPDFVLAAADNPSLHSSAPPINDSFLLTGRADLPTLTEEELGEAATLAVLPLRKVVFDPDVCRLNDLGKTQLREQIAPVLASSTELYLKIEGSAAWPGPEGRYTWEDNIQPFAVCRARSCQQYLATLGIDPDRLVVKEEAIPPSFRWSPNESELEQDRYVQFTLIQPQGR